VVEEAAPVARRCGNARERTNLVLIAEVPTRVARK
jgi:hypothetical protein